MPTQYLAIDRAPEADPVDPSRLRCYLWSVRTDSFWGVRDVTKIVGSVPAAEMYRALLVANGKLADEVCELRDVATGLLSSMGIVGSYTPEKKQAASATAT